MMMLREVYIVTALPSGRTHSALTNVSSLAGAAADSCMALRSWERVAHRNKPVTDIAMLFA